MLQCKSSIWHLHISLTIRNIKLIIESKIIQSESFDRIGVLNFISWFENSYFATMSGNPQKFGVGRFVPAARTSKIAFLVSAMTSEYLQWFWTRGVKEKSLIIDSFLIVVLVLWFHALLLEKKKLIEIDQHTRNYSHITYPLNVFHFNSKINENLVFQEWFFGFTHIYSRKKLAKIDLKWFCAAVCSFSSQFERKLKSSSPVYALVGRAFRKKMSFEAKEKMQKKEKKNEPRLKKAPLGQGKKCRRKYTEHYLSYWKNNSDLTYNYPRDKLLSSPCVHK